MRVSYARRAEFDLDDIVAFGAERWGAEQADIYVSLILDAVDGLADYPGVGSPADELASGLRHLSIGRHVVYYIAEEDEVLVVRILHMSRDAQRYLP